MPARAPPERETRARARRIWPPAPGAPGLFTAEHDRPGTRTGVGSIEIVARIREIVIDALNPPALARFWAAALQGYAVRPYDEAEVERLLALGATLRDEHDTYSVLQDPEGNELCVRDPR